MSVPGPVWVLSPHLLVAQAVTAALRSVGVPAETRRWESVLDDDGSPVLVASRPAVVVAIVDGVDNPAVVGHVEALAQPGDARVVIVSSPGHLHPVGRHALQRRRRRGDRDDLGVAARRRRPAPHRRHLVDGPGGAGGPAHLVGQWTATSAATCATSWSRCRRSSGGCSSSSPPVGGSRRSGSRWVSRRAPSAATSRRCAPSSARPPSSRRWRCSTRPTTPREAATSCPGLEGPVRTRATTRVIKPAGTGAARRWAPAVDRLAS